MKPTKLVLKYPLALTEHQYVSIPADSEILSIQLQRDIPCMWILGDPARELVHKGILCIGTGNSFFHEPGRFIDTVQQGMYVWHFFEGDEISLKAGNAT